jgi:hypothetical protein
MLPFDQTASIVCAVGTEAEEAGVLHWISQNGYLISGTNRRHIFSADSEGSYQISLRNRKQETLDEF